MIKSGVSFMCLFLLFVYPPKISKAMLLCGLYFIIVFIVAYLNYNTFRWGTILYLFSFLIVYIFYYNQVVCEQAVGFDVFMDLLKKLILAYTILLMAQQLLLVAGIKIFPLLNLTQVLNKGIGANSLSGEPSSAGRIMAVLYLGYIRMCEIKYHEKVQLQTLFQEAKWPTLGFLWSMTTMGSGTAFVALGILSLYFIQAKYVFTVLPLLAVCTFLIPYIDFMPLQRAYQVVGAFLSGSQESVIEADHSAASRVTGLMNMLTNVDYFDLNTWIGHGCDYSASFGGYNQRLRTNLIGGIHEYGLISFIVMQLVVYKCIIRKIVSIETLFWIFLFSMTFGNVAYTWGCIMVFTAVRYFQERQG